MAAVIGRLLLMSLAVLLGACDNGCGNEIVQTISSPSGTKQAVVFVRDCGATTGFSTQISILASGGGEVAGVGNTLVVEGRPLLKLRWLSESSVSVSGLGSGRIFKQEGDVRGTSVRYDSAL